MKRVALAAMGVWLIVSVHEYSVHRTKWNGVELLCAVIAVGATCVDVAMHRKRSR